MPATDPGEPAAHAPARPLDGPAADALAATCAAARPLVLLLDIDGTLAPIAPRPEDAHVPAETRAVLGTLAGRPHTHLALVTGRAPADARRLVPVAGAWVIGNHGAERLAPNGDHAVDPAVAAYGPALRQAVAELAGALAATPGAWVENKGWSASVHYRQVAPEDAARLVEAARAAGARAGLRVGDGKMVVELRAPVAVDKGTAGVALARALGADGSNAAVLAAGDDVTDEDLFRRLGEAWPASRRVFTVRVGNPETPTAAAYCLADPDALRGVLEAVAAERA